MAKNKFLSTILLIGILLLAAFFRFYGLNWDQNQHLHPDERFLTMVAGNMRIPENLSNYLDPQVSTLNPYNINYKFFVYGTFPLVITKLLATFLDMDNYDQFTLLGRRVSAIFDMLTLIFIYKLVLLWEEKHKFDKRIKYLACLFYSSAVLPIQLSHFFAAETFINFFVIASIYFTMKYYYNHQFINLIVGAILFGFSLGSKITAVFALPILLFFISQITIKPEMKKISLFSKTQSIKNLLIFLIIAYLSLRIADPKFFQSKDFLDLRLNSIFLDNLKSLKSSGVKDTWHPPGIQWINKPPITYALVNIAFFGLGLPYFFLSVIGLPFLLKHKKVELYILLLFILGFFLYQSSQFAKAMRYFIILYPFFSVSAAYGLIEINSYISKYLKNKVKSDILTIMIILLSLIWPISFMHIYTEKHSRVKASYWINENLEENSYLAQEHWDDSLPLLLPDIRNKKYQGEQMPVFAPDDTKKWQTINETLNRANYIIFTSNRGYGSITTVPERYPKMAKFYQDLFSGQLNFIKYKEVISYPTLNLGVLKIEFNDDWADESFTVYDHPKVIILKKKI